MVFRRRRLQIMTTRALTVMMKVLLLLLSSVTAQNDDLFNYGSTNGRNFGPEDWDQVACDDLETCVRSYHIRDPVALCCNCHCHLLILSSHLIYIYIYNIIHRQVGLKSGLRLRDGVWKKTAVVRVLNSRPPAESTINPQSI